MVAEACKAQRLQSVAFIGTRLAMTEPFFLDRLASHGLEVHVPAAEHHELLDRVIYDELVHGKVLATSRRAVVGLFEDLWDTGAGGIILGCSELELLVHQADSELPALPVHGAARGCGAGPCAGLSAPASRAGMHAVWSQTAHICAQTCSL